MEAKGMTIGRNTLFPLVILLLGLAAYANSFSGVFIFDDAKIIQDNTRIRHVLPIGEREWLERCVVEMTFGLNYATGRLNPADYHATNLAIHLIAALLLYGIVRRTLMLDRIQERFRSAASEIAFVSAAIWVVHPLTTSAVTYISQRYECMMGMFYLMTLYCFIHGTGSDAPVVGGSLSGRVAQSIVNAECGRRGRRPSRFLSGILAMNGRDCGLAVRFWIWATRLSVSKIGWYACAAAACIAGFGSKEVILTAPLLVFMYDRIFIARSFKEVVRRRYGLYVALSVIYVIALLEARMILREPGDHAVGSLSLSYAITQCQVMLHYLKLALWPYPLCADYAWPLVESISNALSSVFIIGILGIGSLLALRYAPPLGFLGASFFVILAPTSSFLARSDVVFEHRMYLPLAVVVTGLVAGAYELRYRLVSRWIFCRRMTVFLTVPACVAILAGLAGMTHLRNRDYRSAETILGGAIAIYPDNIRPYVGLTRILFDEGRYGDVISWSKKALKRLPDFSASDHASVLAALAEAGSGRLITQVFYYSKIHNNMGLALYRRGEIEESARHFEESVRLAPGNLQARANLASALFAMGQTENAIGVYRYVLTRDPGDVATHQCLGEALYCAGDVKGAIESYNTMLKLDPHNVLALTRLAWILATSCDDAIRDGRRAVTLAEDAAKAVNYANSRSLDILAAAYAEAGDFEKAVATARRAAELSTGGEKKAVEERMALYSRRMPYRELGKDAKPFSGSGNADK